jgi:DNA-directed RNA polymerase specialized sigma subunit
MTNLPEHWKLHEIEAYWAWQSNDPNRLVKACHRMIDSIARGFTRKSKRGSDELHPSKEAEFREAGLHEAKQVADFDELYQVGCEAILKIRGRYDPKIASFQAFAYKRAAP